MINREKIFETVGDTTPEEVLEFLTSSSSKTNNKNSTASTQPVVTGDNIAKTIPLADIKGMVNVEELKTSAIEIKDKNILSSSEENKDEKTVAQELRIPAQSDPTLYNDLFNQSSDDLTSQSYLIPLKNVNVTEAEKESYLRSVLENKPWETEIKTAKGKMTFIVRSKTMEVQDMLTKVMQNMITEKDDEGQLKYNPFDIFKFALKANVICGIKSVNGLDVFGDYEHYTLLDDITLRSWCESIDKEVIAKLPGSVWNMYVNVLRIFEKKENLLSEFILNEDF